MSAETSCTCDLLNAVCPLHPKTPPPPVRPKPVMPPVNERALRELREREDEERLHSEILDMHGDGAAERTNTPIPDTADEITLEGGKYRVILESQPGRFAFYAKRNDEDWRDLTGDKLVLAMFQRVRELEKAAAELAAVRTSLRTRLLTAKKVLEALPVREWVERDKATATVNEAESALAVSHGAPADVNTRDSGKLTEHQKKAVDDVVRAKEAKERARGKCVECGQLAELRDKLCSDCHDGTHPDPLLVHEARFNASIEPTADEHNAALAAQDPHTDDVRTTGDCCEHGYPLHPKPTCSRDECRKAWEELR